MEWFEYVKSGLENGQQVFRASTIRKLMDEVGEVLKSTPPTSQSFDQNLERDYAQTRRELTIARKQLQDCQRRSRGGLPPEGDSEDLKRENDKLSKQILELEAANQKLSDCTQQILGSFEKIKSIIKEAEKF